LMLELVGFSSSVVDDEETVGAIRLAVDKPLAGCCVDFCFDHSG